MFFFYSLLYHLVYFISFHFIHSFVRSLVGFLQVSQAAADAVKVRTLAK